MLDSIFPHKSDGLGVQLCAHTVESMTARDTLSGGQGFLLEESGTYVVEKCSGYMPGINIPILPFALMMTSCSILWPAENGFETLYGLANALAKPNPCPGLTLPPPPQKYDVCWGEVFRINKQ
jgi:hypothetical protein